MFTRRRMLGAGAVLTCTPVVPAAPQTRRPVRQRHSAGCCLADDELPAFVDAREPIRAFVTGNEPIIPRSGDRVFDRALAHTLAKISQLFGVVPGFGYYDDYDAMNAYASPKVRMYRADGTVLFGTRLLRRMRAQREAPEVAVAAICAHEFGHIVQFKTGLYGRLSAGQPNVKRVELHADFLAGYFAGMRKKEKADFPTEAFAMTQYHFGDTEIMRRLHHGTPEERRAAIMAGFQVAREQNLPFGEALGAATRYVAAV
jgi:hypothetical protein